MNVDDQGDLKRLFTADGIKGFSKAWPTLPFVWHGPLERYCPPFEPARFADPVEAIRSYRGATNLIEWASERGQTTHYATPSAAAEAYRLTRLSVCLLGFDRAVAGVRGFLEGLAHDLSLPSPATLMHCNAYLSPSGNGFSRHFDAHEVFIIQMCGHKIWRVAPNREVSFPRSNYVAGDPLPSLPEFDVAAGPFGRCDLPEGDVMEVEMAPGSVLFLPRGYWHETLAHEDSVSLTLGIFTPSWLDIVLSTLEDLLGGEEAWRRPAAEAWTSPAEAARHVREMFAGRPVPSFADQPEIFLEHFAGLRRPARRLPQHFA
jgi:ribosomal protein L16 Arg81 hydroxylase